MLRVLPIICALFLMGGVAYASDSPRVKVITTMGEFTLELYPEKAPITVNNFLQYAQEGFYVGTIFHRVIPGFMNQAGGFTQGMQQKPVRAPIQNEANNGLKNDRGTLAMARTSVVNSATAQFFINAADNAFLNYQGNSASQYGYAVFGKVVDGMAVNDLINKTPTSTQSGHADVPVKPITILAMQVIEAPVSATRELAK